MAFIVNSSPGAGLRFEPSETLPDEKAALAWAVGLAQRGMRMIKIRDTVSGQVFDARGLRDHTLKTKQAELENEALSHEAQS